MAWVALVFEVGALDLNRRKEDGTKNSVCVWLFYR